MHDDDRESYQREVRDLRDQMNRLRSTPAEAEQPKPLRQAEIIRSLLRRLEAAQGEHSTIELNRNAKGDTQIRVSVRTGESDAVATAEDAAAEARRIYDALAMLYPMGGPASGSTGKEKP